MPIPEKNIYPAPIKHFIMFIFVLFSSLVRVPAVLEHGWPELQVGEPPPVQQEEVVPQFDHDPAHDLDGLGEDGAEQVKDVSVQGQVRWRGRVVAALGGPVYILKVGNRKTLCVLQF